MDPYLPEFVMFDFRKMYDKYIAIAEGRYVPSVMSETTVEESEVESIDELEDDHGHGKSIEIKRTKIPYSDRFTYFDTVKNFVKFGHRAIYIHRLLTHKTKQVMDISKWKKTNGKKQEEEFFRKLGQGFSDNLSLRGLFARGAGPGNPCSFNGNGIDIVFREAIEFNDHLTFLDLSKNVMEERGTITLMRSVKVNSKLFELDLSNCLIKPKAGTAIMKALIENCTLGRLILENNELKDKGCIKIFKGLIRNKTLKYLNLDNNDITEKSIKELDRCMRRNVGIEKLSIARNPWIKTLEEPIVNTEIRTTTQITISEGDEDKSDHELVRSVLACLVGAVGRDEEASISMQNLSQ